MSYLLFSLLLWLPACSILTSPAAVDLEEEIMLDIIDFIEDQIDENDPK